MSGTCYTCINNTHGNKKCALCEPKINDQYESCWVHKMDMPIIDTGERWTFFTYTDGDENEIHN